MGAIHLIIVAMITHSLDAAVQEEACACLSNLAFSDDKHRAAIIANDGVGLVCKALEYHVMFHGVLQDCGMRYVCLIKIRFAT